jgi:ATP-dependent DNA helicase MPH1
VIDKFKKGIYNVLVATSIGEEGLDIGEVDFIIIYNCPAESIKMASDGPFIRDNLQSDESDITQLQRIGRAGRKRDGKIHVLMTEGREDNNWDQAMFTHREIQAEIIHGRNIELYDDVEPLLPDGKQPECVERIQEVEPWVPEQKKSSKRKLSAASLSKQSTPKRLRGVAVPEGAMTGFISASKLTAGGQTARRKTGKKKALEGWDEESPDLMTMAEELSEGPGKARSSTKVSRKNSDRLSETQRQKKRVIPQDTEREEKSSAQSMQDQAALQFFSTAPGKKSSPLEVSDGENVDAVAAPAAPSRPVQAQAPTGVRLRPQRATVSAGATTSAAGRHLVARNAELDQRPGQTNSSAWMLDVDDEDDSPLPVADRLKATFKSSSLQSNGRFQMGPPSLPTKASVQPTAASTVAESSSPIPMRRRVLPPAVLPQTPEDASDGPRRRAGRSNAARRIVETSSEDSPLLRRPRRDGPKRLEGNHVRQFIETEAGVSDPSEDEDFDSSGQESESDKRFAGDFQATQAPAGYNQQQAYISGLATQVPQGGPAFSRRSDKHSNFLAKARKPIMLSQDAPAGPSSDYFSSDSFIVDDDAPLETYSDTIF